MNLNTKSFFILLIPFLFSNCKNDASDYIDPRGTSYAGSVSCAACHQEIYNEAINSSHFKASAQASIKNVQGHFKTGYNSFFYDKDTKIVMENRNNEFFQVHYKNGKKVKAYRYDIVMGAKNAQTSLFWDKDNFFELPLSYYNSVKNWGTSPGYPPDQPHFDRLITMDCFECHSSHIEIKHKNTESENYFGTEIPTETIKKESLVHGIDCERCHGPAMDHVKYHQENPEQKVAKYIVVNQSLSTQQKLGGCVICHYAGETLKSRFKFVPGSSIADFYNERIPANNSDVHGNQYGLLSQSKCFLGSKSMDCISCHNPHGDAKESIASFSQKCMTCHSEAKNNFCTTKVSNGIVLKENCIDCHMPKKASGVIGFFLSGKSEMSPYLLRTHRIGIYQEETLKVAKKK
jgi:Doubled CXXCH motif (Paired_CXXCH_1)